MPASFQEIINSRLFKFVVGEDSDGIPTEFSVHENAIAQLSKPLHSLVNGALSEAQAGRVIWNDVEKETFERFIQFAYTGDYSIPKPQIRALTSASNGTRMLNKAGGQSKSFGSRYLDKHDPIIEKTEFKDFGFQPAESVFAFHKTGTSWGNPEISKKNKKKTFKDLESLPFGACVVTFQTLKFPLLAPRHSYEDTCEPNENFEASQSYAKVFLAHASLYVLGDFRLIDSLKALALHKLHKTLCIFQLNDKNVEDIIDLARYAYSEEDKGFEEGVGGLRDLICRYMAANVVELSLDAGFMNLLDEGGIFVKDFFKFVVYRMR